MKEEKDIKVYYNGMKCRMFKSYYKENDGPWLMILSSTDINKAYQLGFDCMGYPSEIAKKITEEEYNTLISLLYLFSLVITLLLSNILLVSIKVHYI
ncbi:hypothetical protein BCR32DRAFT_297016 [Anaeromyces robustus]|uniref:Uncharacterized protein n=1 Tax=Anaeromyces robustus TaxID=1754192 RepID=A0A1Y1WNX1_9FUNG|nr:hypothetical protein BCR32DRAFT_297016 [Anaeromyces robustus]|eukprot:ORX75229.1 hypothetical protein BCR32DRAFT_297016 [Anaeromyces robustus]